jgi:hypothetical protein
MRRLVHSLVIANVIGACALWNEPEHSIAKVATNKHLYAPGDTVVPSLTNVSPDTIGYNICSQRRLQILSGFGWTEVTGSEPEAQRLSNVFEVVSP